MRISTPGARSFVEKLRELFLSLGQNYKDIIAIFLSSQMHPMVECARKRQGGCWPGLNPVDQLADHLVGLGLLVQTAAEAVAQGITQPKSSASCAA